MHSSPEPLLVLRGLRKSFGAVRALRGVSFELKAGEVHALLGENGAGKSTLIKIITGAHKPDEGFLRIAGEDVARLTPATAHRLGIACTYQQPALFPDLTVAENLALALEPPSPWRLVRHRARMRRAAGLLQEVGAHLDPSREVRDLSMPEQQVVEIAKAIGAGARILILDEPTAALARPEVEALLGLVRTLRERGTGVIYITHRLEEIAAVADRVTVLRDGESVGTFPGRGVSPAELIRHMVGRDLAAIYPPPQAPPRETVLSVRELHCAATGLRGASFSLRAGEVFGLPGLVGAGRTALAEALFGLAPADGGVIELGGKPIAIRNPREAIGHGLAYVPEDRRRHGVILPESIAHNISLAALGRLFPSRWLRPKPERTLALQQMRELLIKAPSPEAPVSTLSGGNQQKVALARWLVTAPRVLILNEPTQGVDVGAKAEIHALIRQLAANGLAVLLISSDLPEVLGMSDRLGIMRGGVLVETMSGAEATADRVMAAALGHAGEEAA